jgi:hypothetical protein
MKSLRWDDNPRQSYRKQVFTIQVNIQQPPTCRCGRSMHGRAGYVMGGDSDWMAYSCAAERPWNHWFHSPWTTVRKGGRVIGFKQNRSPV